MPARQTLSVNDSVTFSCTTEGGPSNVFQWSLGDVNLTGENGTFLNVTNVNATDGGTYTCTVRNQAGVEQDTAELFGECHKSLLLGPRYVGMNESITNCFSCSAMIVVQGN